MENKEKGKVGQREGDGNQWTRGGGGLKTYLEAIPDNTDGETVNIHKQPQVGSGGGAHFFLKKVQRIRRTNRKIIMQRNLPSIPAGCVKYHQRGQCPPQAQGSSQEGSPP